MTDTTRDDPFTRLRSVKSTIVDEAKAAAESAVAVLPDDLAPEEEPAHTYQAEPGSGA